eukprot:s4476_g2.t1
MLVGLQELVPPCHTVDDVAAERCRAYVQLFGGWSGRYGRYFVEKEAVQPSGLELFITIVNEDANCTMQDFKTKAPSIFEASKTRFYLMDEMTKIQPNPFGEKKDMVRWTEDPVKWDVLTAEDLKTAERYGKVLVDQDLTNEDMGWKSYIYTATQDRDWVAKNCNITQTVELTKAFQEQLELVRSHKFGE